MTGWAGWHPLTHSYRGWGVAAQPGASCLPDQRNYTKLCRNSRKSIPWIEPRGARDQAERTSDVGCVEGRPLPRKAALPSPPRHRSSALLGFGGKVAMDGK
jgi:hypothetical protein